MDVNESAAIVPIPVFGQQVSEEPAALADDTKTHTPDVPPILVSKPPAPQPVNLPSADDVVPLPSPPDSKQSSIDVDLEAGRGVRRPVDDDLVATKLPVRKVTPPEVMSRDDVDLSPTGEEDTDLLAQPSLLEAVLTPPDIPDLEPIPQAADTIEPSTSLPPAEETTVRLVGGSSSGADSTTFDNTEEAVISDVAAVAVTKPSESPPKKEQPHGTTKSSSLSSFKRLSIHFTGGKRKKDSVSSSSVKETL